MNDDFNILVDFLGRLGPQVSGRILSEPHSAAAAQLDRFARGECDKLERKAVCEMLRMHPAWMRWLADRVRLARTLAGAPADSADAN